MSKMSQDDYESFISKVLWCREPPFDEGEHLPQNVIAGYCSDKFDLEGAIKELSTWKGTFMQDSMSILKALQARPSFSKLKIKSLYILSDSKGSQAIKIMSTQEQGGRVCIIDNMENIRGFLNKFSRN